MTKRVVIGIDAQTDVVATACVDDGGVKVYRIERNNRVGTRQPGYASKLVALMRRAQELGAVIFLEDVYFEVENTVNKERRNVVTLKRLSEVQGEIKLVADMHRVPVENVTANEWHSAILGATVNRNALKEKAQERALRETGEALDEHSADAVCIALYGRRLES